MPATDAARNNKCYSAIRKPIPVSRAKRLHSSLSFDRVLSEIKWSLGSSRQSQRPRIRPGRRGRKLCSESAPHPPLARSQPKSRGVLWRGTELAATPRPDLKTGHSEKNDAYSLASALRNGRRLSAASMHRTTRPRMAVLIAAGNATTMLLSRHKIGWLSSGESVNTPASTDFRVNCGSRMNGASDSIRHVYRVQVQTRENVT